MLSALLRLGLRCAPTGAQLALVVLLAACVVGCAGMIEPQRRQCWQDCGQTVYPNCQADPAEVLAIRKWAEARRRGAARVHDSPAKWGGGKRRSRTCRRELAACLELCYESENGMPTVDEILQQPSDR